MTSSSSQGFGSILDQDGMMSMLFPMGDPPNYEPCEDESIAAIARREGRSADEVLYDYMLHDEGRELLLMPFFNYSNGSLEPLLEMMRSPYTIVSLGDGGAHCGLICDASLPTFLLTHWVRDRSRGERVPLALAVHRQTQETARLYGLLDRGVIAPGYKADFNVIDFDALRLHRPKMAFDLPGGARRLLQRADGYDAKIVNGEIVMEQGTPTGAMPGRLLRGAQSAPSLAS